MKHVKGNKASPILREKRSKSGASKKFCIARILSRRYWRYPLADLIGWRRKRSCILFKK